jgi:hypothetical protein
MELTTTLNNKALNVLRYEGVSGLPKQIGKTPFYVAVPEDVTIFGHGVVIYNEKEYKIGTKK